MPTPIRPASVKTFGGWKWAYAPTIADVTAPKVSELTATGALDLSCFLFASSTFPSIDTNTVDRTRRLCEITTYQALGSAKINGGELHYGVDPQAAAGADAKKAYTILGVSSGTVTGFLVGRAGPTASTDFAVGQYVETYPVAFGLAVVTNEGDDEAAEAAINQTYVVTGPKGPLAALVA